MKSVFKIALVILSVGVGIFFYFQYVYLTPGKISRLPYVPIPQENIDVPLNLTIDKLRSFFQSKTDSTVEDASLAQAAPAGDVDLNEYDASITERETLTCLKPDHSATKVGSQLIILKIGWIEQNKMIHADPYFIRFGFKNTNQQQRSCSQKSYAPIQIGDVITIDPKYLNSEQILDLCNPKTPPLQYVAQCSPSEIISLLQQKDSNTRAILIEILKTKQRDLATVQAIAKRIPEIIFADWLNDQDPDYVAKSFDFRKRLQSNNKDVVEDTLKFCFKYPKKCTWTAEDLARLESIIGREAFLLWLNENPELKKYYVVAPAPTPVSQPAVQLPPPGLLPPAPPADPQPSPAAKTQAPSMNVAIGKTYKMENGCIMEFTDVEGKFDLEYVQSVRPDTEASFEEKKFFSCFAHIDRKLQARNNQRMKVTIAQLRSNCEKGDTKSCREYSGWCQPPRNEEHLKILDEGRWPGKPCNEIDSLSR